MLGFRALSIGESPFRGSGVYPSEWLLAHRTEVSAQNYEARGRRATPSLGVINKRATAFNDDVSIEDF